ncbi:lipid A biosynthesis acyltransferase [Inhella sp. 4Y17]|uniref:Lipid A biosynthesis acyltransferase n=2 Tax=Inhella gelatinilytica TaxID=2795030 RepID=A0A931IWB4_9BURK|nr:lipid A biosynthesis acyltransferase [Inhella gelatinilytica]
MGRLGARLAIALLWLLHWLPLPALAALGRGLGALLWRLARSRKRIALRNLALCFPEKSEVEREALARAHFGWMGQSILDRGLLWFAPPERLLRLIQVEGDIHQGAHSDRPVMWLLPHFAGLEWVGPALTLMQTKPAVDVYQHQRNAVFDAQLMRGRGRFGQSAFVSRHEGIRPVLKKIREGYGFVNAPDMDFGLKDSEFVPFFGVQASTLLAPAKMAASLNMVVLPLVVTMLPQGRGYRISCPPPLSAYPSGDALTDARTLNTWLEARIREQPAQYLWVHRRFKTRPAGEPPVY